MKKTIHIVAGGPEAMIPDLTTFKSSTNIFWIGVDHGVFRLISKGIIPDMAFGDFDSVTNQEWDIIAQKAKSLKRYQPEKDETDMELALFWALKQSPSNIIIFGATGGRADHYFANAMMLVRTECLDADCRIEIVDKQNILSVFKPGEYKIKKIKDKKYISFVPLSCEVEGISLINFKYPLHNKHIFKGSSLCISNELIQETGTFSFTKGILMMIRSQD